MPLSEPAQALIDQLTAPDTDPDDEVVALSIPYGLPAGERKLVQAKVSGPNSGIAPDNSKFAFFDGGDWKIYDFAAATTRNITAGIPAKFWNTEDDHNQVKPPIGGGFMGWSKSGTDALIRDNWDVWRVPLAGPATAAVNITGNGLTLYYHLGNPDNAYLGGKTYELAGGGTISPVPEPAGFRDAPVRPAAAYYHAELGEFILPYQAVRTAASPEEDLSQFIETTYDRAATLGKWDRAALERNSSDFRVQISD